MVDWVGISGMGCDNSSEDMAIHDPQGHTGDTTRRSLLEAGVKKYSGDNWQAQPKVAPPDSAWIKYAFIKRQTEKAILFAFNDKNGLSEQWVPKSVITGLQADPNRVKISQWFITRSILNV